jgi:hypothetical protein
LNFLLYLFEPQYINSAAILAKQLRNAHSKIAVLDVDYHCGNGTIGVFWNDPSVYVCSIHADPDLEYPYTCGFADQVHSNRTFGFAFVTSLRLMEGNPPCKCLRAFFLPNESKLMNSRSGPAFCELI